MKVIKHLKKQTPEEKLRRFLLQIPLITKCLLILFSMIGVLLLLFGQKDKIYTVWSLASMRGSELILFLIVGVSDLKRQERKGSFYLLLGVLVKGFVILGCQCLVKEFTDDWPSFGIFANTAIIIQYLIIIMIEDALAQPALNKYLFIEPFQLKSRFYPLFFIAFLTIANLRIDFLITVLLALLIHFTSFNRLIKTISECLDKRLVSESMQNNGFIKTGSEGRTLKPLDELATNDSIVLQQK